MPLAARSPLAALCTLLAGALTLPGAAWAQDTSGVGSIAGVVFAGDGTPAAGVTICVAGTDRCSTSVAGGKGSWIVSARRSFLDYFTDDIGIGGVPVIYAVNGKVVYDISARDRVWAVNVTGVDTLRLGSTATSDPADSELANAGYSWDRRNNRIRFGEQQGIFPLVDLEWSL